MLRRLHELHNADVASFGIHSRKRVGFRVGARLSASLDPGHTCRKVASHIFCFRMLHRVRCFPSIIEHPILRENPSAFVLQRCRILICSGMSSWQPPVSSANGSTAAAALRAAVSRITHPHERLLVIVGAHYGLIGYDIPTVGRLCAAPISGCGS